jgi:hypothetical protein
VGWATSLCLALAAPLATQEVSGSLGGRLEDDTGRPVEGAVVSIRGSTLPGPRTTTTDGAGRFRVPDLPVGRYDVSFDRIGVRSMTVTGVQIRLGRSTPLGVVTVSLDAVDLSPVVVRRTPRLLDPRSTDLSSDIRSTEFQDLPIGRDYRTIVEILPQVNRSYLGDPVNVAGATGLENMYFVEGVNVTDVYRGRTGTALPYNFVEAVEVKQAGYEAEFGQAMGGIVNVVTRSGTPEFAWDAFGFYSGSAVAADAAPVPNTLAQRSFLDVDLGVSASGPIVADRVVAFGAYNPRFARSDLELPNLGIERASSDRHVFAGKLQVRASPRSDFTLSVFGDPTWERRVSPAPGITLLNPDPILTSANEGGVNGALRWAFRPSDALRLEAVVSRHTRREDAEGATALGREQPSFIDRTGLPTILLSGGNGTDQRIRSARTSAKLSASLEAGGHTLKAGLELQQNRLDVENLEAPGQVAWLTDGVYRSSIFIQDVVVENRVSTLFVQNGWQVDDRLHLNVGLRWDGQSLLDQDGDVGQSIMDQLQPRVGIAFLPGRDGRTKVFAHAGRFYQQLALLWSTIGLAGFDQRQVFTSTDPRQPGAVVDSTLIISDPDDVRGGTDGLRGEHHDEVALGVVRQLGDHAVLSVRGLHRVLRESITSAFRPDREFAGGNPGSGPLDHLPPSERTYSSLEVSFRAQSERLSALASYVLSRSEGNYPGLFVADAGGLRGGSFGPNNNQLTYFPAQPVNAAGLLPNDRPHVFKLSGSYDATNRLSAGLIVQVQSGTPLSELGRVTGGFNAPLFLTPRGTEGRTPTTWDLNLRVTYAVSTAGRVIVDLLNLGNPQAVVNVDQRRFNGARGSPFASYDELVANQRGERPGFGTPVAFQPPFQVRVGVEVGR